MVSDQTDVCECRVYLSFSVIVYSSEIYELKKSYEKLTPKRYLMLFHLKQIPNIFYQTLNI